MFSKRLISLILSIICAALLTAAPFFAAVDPNADAQKKVKPTVKPTAAPTEPPLTPEAYGYSEYIKKLETTVCDDSVELGAIYTPDYTTFRLWSPTASAVKVCIYTTGSDGEKGAQTLSSTPMKYVKKTGCWYLTLDDDYKNMYYTYKVTVNGETHEVVDPYAKAVGVNGDRGMIVDLKDTNPKGWSNDSFSRVTSNTDAVVWEVSVKDFSAAASSGVSEKNRGKYLAFTESDTTLNGEKDGIPTCVNYLKELGVNYVHINPFFDFASIDEKDTDSEQYNWGYDPKNYNAPEGSYSSNPYNGTTRIKECKQMIQALHNAGIGVIMDVVYNHTYESDNSFFNRIVPYYYYRMTESGKWSNGSQCGNDIASERYMVRRFIRDSVTYWASEYHIDGFRFDLMGLIDADTMGTVRSSLDALPGGKTILMYGEAWNMSTETSLSVTLANQDNYNVMSKRIGAFNDKGRDAICKSRNSGFVEDGSEKSGIRGMFDGDGGGWASIPNQVVNYASCHDNLTLYDRLYDNEYNDDDYELRREKLVRMNKLSAATVMMSRGMPFMLAGEEFARTKDGDENSYKSSVKINQLDWKRIEKFPSLVDYYKGLIRLRGSLDAIRDPMGDTELTYLDTDGGECIAYQATRQGSPIVIAAFNGDNSEKSTVSLPEGKWVMLADGEFAGLSSLGTYTDTVTVPATSAVVLVNASGYAKIGDPVDEAAVYVRVIDSDNDVTVFEKKYTGKKGDTYSDSIPDSILFRYNFEDNKNSFGGTFEKDFEVVTIKCEKYEGNYSSVTFRYLNESGENVYSTVVSSNRVGQQYYSPALPSVVGYTLDLTRLPDNGAGEYTDDPIEVIYYYKQAPAFKPPKGHEDYNCLANVIYMGSDGKILTTKSFAGAEGDKVEVEELEFDGYEYHGKSDNYATFTRGIESNIIVNYEKKTVKIFPYLLVGGVAILLIGAFVFYFVGRGKRKKIESIEIEE